MLIALGCITLVALAALTLAYRLLRAYQEAQAQAVLERRELLERIQRPERVPAPAATEPFHVPDRDPEQDRAWAQVGSVVSIGENYGIGEDG